MTNLTFEQVYPRAQFAPLIRLAIALGAAWAVYRDRRDVARHGHAPASA